MLRIYLECSQTAANDNRTGIQRVVRSVILHHAKAARALRVKAQPAQLLGDQFLSFRWRPANDSSESSRGKSLADKNSSAFVQIDPEWRVAQTTADSARGKKKKRFRKIRRRFRSLWQDCRSLWLSCFRKLRPSAGDLIVMTDGTWELPIWPAIENWRRQGGKVAFIIYDILPITNPEFFVPKLSRLFGEWFYRVCRNADLLLTISDTVRDQLRAMIGSNGDVRSEGSPQIESFRLGAGLDMWHLGAHVRPSVHSAFDPVSGSTPYLMVGTIEPRKNHTTVLDAFDRLWERGSGVRLVLVGRPGWKIDAIERRLLTHPQRGRGLYWFPDLSDTELEYCYRHAKALVFASWCEGFGLPIVEGLQHGLPVIASDLPVHREVAGGFAAYFDPALPEALVAWIQRLETSGRLPGVLPAKDFRPVSWYEGTTDLLLRCREFAEGQRAPRFQQRKA